MPIEVPFDTGFSTSQTDWKHIGSFRNLSLGRKSFSISAAFIFDAPALGSYVMTPLSRRPCALFIDPYYCCGSPPPPVFASFTISLPMPADSNCTGAPAPGCLYCSRCYSRDQNKQGGCSAGRSKSYVCAAAQSAAGGIQLAPRPVHRQGSRAHRPVEQDSVKGSRWRHE